MRHKHFREIPEDPRRRYFGFTLGTGLAIAGIGLAGAMAYSASKSKADSPAIQPIPEPPAVEKAEVQAQEAITKKKRAVARNRTIFTGPLGLGDEDKSNLAKKTLLGE